MKFFPTVVRRAGKISVSIFHALRAVKLSARPIHITKRLGPSVIATALIIAFFLSVSVWRGGSAIAITETITTVSATDCSTPKSTWNLGQSACARVTGAPIGSRRIVWVAPDGSVAQVAAVASDPATDTYAIPTDGSFAQVGIWKVKTIDNRGVGHVSAAFTVLSATDPNTDLAVTVSGPNSLNPGSSVTYTVTVTNNGPDDAQNVVVTDAVPLNTTFGSATQTGGPAFTINTAPDADGNDTTTATISTLAANASATFALVYTVSSTAPDGTVLFDVVSVSSSTNEINSANNTAAATTRVSSAAACALTCPDDITQDNDANQCGAVVNYTVPSGTNCTNVICTPPSGSFFPTGTPTPVTCAGDTGNSCGFNVRIHDTRTPATPTITCPGDITVGEEFDGAGEAPVSYASPTTTGNCVNVVCSPPSGSNFVTGTTTVTCTATDSSNNSVTCSFTVTVNGSGCTLTCPGDVTVTAAADHCDATVNYSAPTSNNCGTVACSPPSGSVFNVGSSVVTCSGSQGGSCDFNVTVLPASAPVITHCASNKTVSVNAGCEAAIPNLLPEVTTTGCSVTLSQSPSAGTIVGPGTYTVTITAENLAGDTPCTATVTVVDSTPPVITSSCPATASATADANCQAAVPNVTAGVTATDNCTPAGSLVITQSPAAGSLVSKGVTSIVVSVRDQAGNTSTCTTTFTVSDVTAPAITCPADVVVYLPLNSTATSMSVNFTVTATDNCPGVTVASTPASGSVFPVGTTTVTSTATDTSNNSSSCTFTVTVLYDFTGFFSPVANPPSLNTVNAGRAIPVKFSLSGNKGLSILAAGYPVSGTIACDASAPPNEITETVTAGSSSLSYDAASDQYIYTWATSSSWAGTCRQLIVKLNDGSTHVANFKFR